MSNLATVHLAGLLPDLSANTPACHWQIVDSVVHLLSNQMRVAECCGITKTKQIGALVAKDIHPHFESPRCCTS